MYRKAKRDKNEKEIVEALRNIGATVSYIDGKGVPDLLVGYYGDNLLFEVKSEKGQLTYSQIEWHENWHGEAHVVHSVEEVLDILTVRRK